MVVAGTGPIGSKNGSHGSFGHCGWVLAANIAADLAAWTRLLGHCDDEDLRDADPDTLRYLL